MRALARAVSQSSLLKGCSNEQTDVDEIGREVHLATAMDLGERLYSPVEAFELQPWIVFQYPALKALGITGSLELGNPFAQVIDGMGPAALFADPELDIGNACLCQLKPTGA